MLSAICAISPSSSWKNAGTTSRSKKRSTSATPAMTSTEPTSVPCSPPNSDRTALTASRTDSRSSVSPNPIRAQSERSQVTIESQTGVSADPSAIVTALRPRAIAIIVTARGRTL